MMKKLSIDGTTLLGIVWVIAVVIIIYLSYKTPNYPIGDITKNGYVTAADIKALEEIVLGIVPTTPEDLKLGDINGDGKITSTDITILARRLEAENE